MAVVVTVSFHVCKSRMARRDVRGLAGLSSTAKRSVLTSTKRHHHPVSSAGSLDAIPSRDRRQPFT